MISLTVRYPFSASHRLHSSALNEQRNWDVYGKCNNPFGHGHNYFLEVTVSGEPNPQTGQLLERPQLDEWVGKEILARVAHRNLNEQMVEFKDLVPTTENVAHVFGGLLSRSWARYFPPSAPLRFERLRIYETRNNLFEMEAHEVQ